MKKILIMALLLSVSTISVFADRLILIQGTYLHTNRIYEYTGGDSKRSYGEAGINFTSFSGKNLGFYSSATFLIPVSYKYEQDGTVNTSIDIDSLNSTYDQLTLGLDMLLGVGFLAPVTPGFSLLVSGGLHFNGVVLMSSNYAIDPYLAYNLGPGVAVNALLNITNSLNFNVSAMGAWDVMEFVTMPETTYDSYDKKGGITWAISAGLGFAY